MKNFFINSFETAVDIFVALMILVVLYATWGVLVDGYRGGFLAALFTLVGGTISVFISAGVLYLFLGIYQNTKRTAEAADATNDK